MLSNLEFGIIPLVLCTTSANLHKTTSRKFYLKTCNVCGLLHFTQLRTVKKKIKQMVICIYNHLSSRPFLSNTSPISWVRKIICRWQLFMICVSSYCQGKSDTSPKIMIRSNANCNPWPTKRVCWIYVNERQKTCADCLKGRSMRTTGYDIRFTCRHELMANFQLFSRIMVPWEEFQYKLHQHDDGRSKKQLVSPLEESEKENFQPCQNQL